MAGVINQLELGLLPDDIDKGSSIGVRVTENIKQDMEISQADLDAKQFGHTMGREAPNQLGFGMSDSMMEAIKMASQVFNNAHCEAMDVMRGNGDVSDLRSPTAMAIAKNIDKSEGQQVG